MSLRVATALALLTMACAPAAAASLGQQDKLFSPARDPAAITQRYFAQEMSSADRTLVVSDGTQYDGNILRIFERDAGGRWQPTLTLDKPAGLDASEMASFGNKFALGSGVLAVLVRGSQANAVGKLLVYEEIGGSWTETARITLPSGDLYNHFFGGLAASGDTIVAGAMNSANPGGQSMAVLSFGRQGGTWARQQVVVAADPVAGDNFGSTLVLQGDRMVARRSGRHFQESQTEGVYVFERSAGLWTQRSKLTVPADGATFGRYFGATLALDGDRLAIPDIVVRSENNVTAEVDVVRVYERQANGSWARTDDLEAGRHSGNTTVGPIPVAIALRGDRLLIHEVYLGSDITLGKIPSVFFFERGATGWTAARRLTPFDWASDAQRHLGLDFGRRIAIDELGTALIAAPLDGLPNPSGMNANASGAIYLLTDSTGIFCNGFEANDPGCDRLTPVAP